MLDQLSGKSRIALKLIFSIIAFSSLITLVATIFQLVDSYNQEVGKIRNDIDEIRITQINSLGHSLWNLDIEAIQVQLNGLAKIRGIENLKAVSDQGRIWEVGKIRSVHTITENFPITYTSTDTVTLGELHLVAGIDYIYDETIDKALFILISNAIKTFLVAIFAFLTFRFLVTRHLTSIASYLEQMNLKQLKTPYPQEELVLEELPSSNSSDEIGQIVSAINLMRQRIQRDLKLKEQLDQSVQRYQKIEALGQLTGGIAHDFNNMLAVILGNLDLLRDEVSKNPKAMEYISAAIRGGARGTEITKRLVDFSNTEPTETQLVNINNFITSLKSLIAKALTPKISLKLHLADDIWNVNVNTGEFEDALINLSLNARDAMPGGGTLIIESANKTLDETYVALNRGSSTGEHVMISVSDTGSGMPQEIIDRAFEPFFTTKDKGNGSGLGLNMVYGFVQRSNGHVKIYSEVGEGTTFHIYLPRATEPSERQKTGADNSTKNSLPGGNETILVVDDEQELLKVAVQHLERLGYNVLTATRGKQALDIFKERDDIDLLFSDVVMPDGTSGYRLAIDIMKSHQGTKALLTSGFTPQHEIAVNGDKPIYDKLSRTLLNKPYSLTELAHAIRQALDEKE